MDYVQIDANAPPRLTAKGSGDVDGDGLQDVIGRRAFPLGQPLYIWRQVSKTSWALTRINLPEPGTGLAVARIDGDAKPDIAVGKYWLKNLSTQGHVKFRLPVYTYNEAAEQDARIAAGDINGDGRTDLLVTPPHPVITSPHKVAWYEAPADRTAPWTEHLLEPDAPAATHSAWVVDVDGDGRQDLVTAVDSHYASPPIKLYLNQGGGTFTTQVIANDAQHMMQVLTVGGRKALVGADYNETPKSSVDMWLLPPTLRASSADVQDADTPGRLASFIPAQGAFLSSARGMFSAAGFQLVPAVWWSGGTSAAVNLIAAEFGGGDRDEICRLDSLIARSF